MTPKTLLIAIACGLAAAIAFVSPLTLGGLGRILSTFSAMPLFVSALGFGTTAGLVSGTVAGLVVAVFFGPLAALAVAAATLIPALIVGHLAGLVRNDDGVEEWYPLSRIFTVMVLISAAIGTAMLGLTGYSSSTMEQSLLEVMQEVAASFPEESRSALNEEALAAQAKLFAGLIPFVISASALFVLLLNLHFAAKIARAGGWMLRPRDHIPSETALPVFMAAIFAASVALSFFGGGLGLGSRVIAGAAGFGFLLTGLATIHFLTQGRQSRGFLLGMLYASFFIPIFAQVALFAMISLGLAETFLGLRARRASQPPST